MKLSPRLETICNEVIEGLPLADIGTDHCKIPVELVERNIIPKAIATDINTLPLSRAEDNVISNHLEDKIELRLGSGLNCVAQDEVDQIIIAGMGGYEMKAILEEDLKKAHHLKKLILQPMSQQEELREFLFENGFKITSERIIKEDKHFYQILTAESGDVDDYDQFDLEFGYAPARIIDSHYLDFIKYKINFYSKNIEKMSYSENEKTKRRRQDFERRLIFLNKLYESKKDS